MTAKARLLFCLCVVSNRAYSNTEHDTMHRTRFGLAVLDTYYVSWGKHRQKQ